MIIDFCEIQPFIVTLAGLFLLRGSCFMINLDSVPIQPSLRRGFRRGQHSRCRAAAFWRARRSSCWSSLVAAIVIAHFTRFGANVYAIGGDRASAALMGVPMRRTMMGIYALGGFYSALGGVIYALYTSSGYPLAGTGDELSAIAAVVLGGTLLTGGVGLVAGTLFGGMILGPDRDADQFQRLAQRGLDHDQRRRAAVPVHRDAAIPPRIVQTAGRRLRHDRMASKGSKRRRADRARRAGRRIARRPSAPRGRQRAAEAFERNIHTSLAGKLGREIVSGVYPPGSLLPNASEMCAALFRFAHGVARGL